MIEMISRKNIWKVLVPLVIFLFVLSFSAIKACFGRVERILFFPHDIHDRIVGEQRLMLQRDDEEANIRDLIEEMILGTRLPQVARSLPRNLDIQAMAYRDQTVYLDLSDELVLSSDTVRLSFDEMLAIIRKTLFVNFPEIEKIIITVDGELPFQQVEREVRKND